MKQTETVTLNEASIDSYEQKIKALEVAVEADRLHPIDFVGKRYYDDDYIRKANAELAAKLSEEDGEDDEAARLAEWEFTYTLNHDEVLPSCRANLASEYDDHLNGVDIVCQIPDKNGENHVFGVDVCTATLPEAVARKFARGDRPRGAVPVGCTFLKFFKDEDYVACLKGVPRFVVGASPLFNGEQKYLNKFNLEDTGEVSHAPDPDLQFNVLSSLFIQSSVLRKRLMVEGTGDEQVRERAIETCSVVRGASMRSLYRLMGLQKGDDFIKRFNEELTKARQIKVNGYADACYQNVIKESLKRQ